jgi:hypothetical protein
VLQDPGRRHHQTAGAPGGGFEEVFLAWGPTDYLDPASSLAQTEELAGPGLSIVRTATDGTDDHPNFRYGLAALLVFGAGEQALFVV